MLDFAEYIDFHKGNIPLIISVSHGGKLECIDIPKRSQGILGIDGRTIKIAKKLIGLIKLKYQNQTGTAKTPSYIVSKVRRSKIDLNRDETEAYVQSSLTAKKIYNFYFDKIREIVLENLNLFNRSLLVDVHGFEKHKRPQGYRDVELILGTNNLKSIFPEPVSIKERGNNIRGKIIRKFQELNIPIAPSHPKRIEYVLTGGYITKQFGASQIPKSQAIQIEFSDRIRIYDKKLGELVLNSLANIFFENFKQF